MMRLVPGGEVAGALVAVPALWLGGIYRCAVKYTPPGDEVEVVVSRVGANVVLAVQDTGIGRPTPTRPCSSPDSSAPPTPTSW